MIIRNIAETKFNLIRLIKQKRRCEHTHKKVSQYETQKWYFRANLIIVSFRNNFL